MTQEVETDRHPFRFMFKLIVFLGIIAAAVKFLASKREEYAGLTEWEARQKMESKLGPRLGEEKASEIADQVIPVLKDRGFLKDGEDFIDKAKDAATNAADKAKDAASTVADKTKDAAGTVTDKAKGAANTVADKAKDAADTVADKTKDAAGAVADKAKK